ncbi:MAG TPA: two-component regulator propeller domain-containing protein, partial [Verrucomicrobiae bacterium]|nr:two-component regulator propeller domain-containing protein [Verrucomicrobiae bacterium]
MKHQIISRNWALLLFAVLFVQLWLPLQALALDPANEILQYSCRTWGRQSGLPVNGINTIAQSKDGYLWFGTSVGIVRFDGVEFKLVDLSRIADIRNGIVNSLYPARNGGLWVGLENSSFGFYDEQNFSFRGQDAWGQVDMNVHSIIESKDGTLWFASEREGARLTSATNFEDVLVNGSATNEALNILCGYQDLSGRLWFGTAHQGVYFWEAGKITKLTDPTLDEAGIFSITEDKDGQIWVGTGQGLRCYDSHLQPKDIPPLPGEIRTLLVDHHGILWIGTSGHGLARYQKGDYTYLKKSDGLASDYVRALAEDGEGNLWVGTRDGVSQLADVKFPIQPAADDPSVKDALSVSISTRGGLWIGSPNGLSYFDPVTKTYTAKAGLPNPYVKRAYESSDGHLYVVSGTRNLVVYAGDTVIATNLAASMVVGLAEDKQGMVVSVGAKLYRAGTNYLSPYVFNEGQTPDFYWILNLASSKDGAIWVACGNGIIRVKDGNTQQFLPGIRAGWICEDDEGVIWAGLLTGIVRIKDGQAHIISRKQGLFDNNIYSIVPDNLGNLWLDSGRGIFRVNRKSMNDCADGKTNLVECTVYDGLEAVKTTDKTVQEHVGCKTADGRIWFPSPRGVIIIDPAHVPTNRIAPPVEIDSLQVNGKGFPTEGQVVVPPGKSDLEFHFDALSFIAPEKIHY